MTTARSRGAREIALFIACFFVVWCVRATCLYAIDESILWPAYLAHVANNLVAGLLVVGGGT